jgi:hypothetical protein
MTITIILFAIILTLILNLSLVRKIGNKTSRISMGVINIIACLVFMILVVLLGAIKNNLSSVIDEGIQKLENKVNEVYPGALEKQMSTEEIKEVLEESLEIDEVDGFEALAQNIIKSRIEKLTSVTLKTINALERENDRLSVKDALISIKEMSVEAIIPYYKTVLIILSSLYFLFIIISILLSLHLAKDSDSDNEGIVFGEEADKTVIGMKSKKSDIIF